MLSFFHGHSIVAHRCNEILKWPTEETFRMVGISTLVVPFSINLSGDWTFVHRKMPTER